MSDKKVKIGVFGAGRGETMMQYCKFSNNAQLVAVCDNYDYSLSKAKNFINDDSVSYYSAFDKFIDHDMDAVVLANYATEHAGYAIKCLKKGLNVISEVLPVQTLKEAVELTEAVEETGKIYAYAENYCFMAAPKEMRKLYREGKIGKFEYGEGEYMHNCEECWDRITHGEKNHWRNNMYASFYCTHSIGPLIHITGQRPVSVSGFEVPFNKRMARMGAMAGPIAVEMITLESGAILKSVHGVGCSRNSIWYSIYGEDGRMESAREDSDLDGVDRLYVNAEKKTNYEPKDSSSIDASVFDHGGSDFYTMYNFAEAVKGNKDAEIIDVYEALDMFLPGLFAYRSILNGNQPFNIPNFRNKEEREKYRNDTACTSPETAGDMLIPSYSKGNPQIPDEVYENVKEKWNNRITKKNKLKMIIFPSLMPLGEMPDGYSISKYSDEKDIEDWIEICKNGLLSDDADRNTFDERITNVEGIVPTRDIYFIEHNGKKVATITAVPNWENSGYGNIHMVSVLTEERGHGLGKSLNAIAVRHLYNNNCKIATLVTDDWRKAACKSYLQTGFLPVNYDDDMKDRWTALLNELQIPSAVMVKENGEPDMVIYKDKQ